MVWIRVVKTGAVWELTEEKANELLLWYPTEYEVTEAPVVAEQPSVATPSPSVAVVTDEEDADAPEEASGSGVPEPEEATPVVKPKRKRTKKAA
jgi:hypothetical protein